MEDQQLREIVESRKVVYPGKIIRLEHWQVRLPNGEQALREVACHPGASAVVALDDNGQVILVRQHRVAVDRVTLEIPAGKLDSPTEDPFVCAKRELSEETGYTASHWEKLTCLDVRSSFLQRHDLSQLIAADGIHLSHQGYDFLFGLLFDALQGASAQAG